MADDAPCPNCSPQRGNAAAPARRNDHGTGDTKGQLPPMVDIPAQRFAMGSEDPDSIPQDGEGPVRDVSVGGFSISRTAVTTAQWALFIGATGYRTDAERFGWSFVFGGLLPDDHPPTQGVVGAEWWRKVDGANWHQPEGPHSTVDGRDRHPAVHLSWNDASAYCEWVGGRLPTETEWECAARGGLPGKRFSWGDEFAPGGVTMCNIFDGAFPNDPSGDVGTVAADAFPANGYGLHNVSGNVWEWCANDFDEAQPGVRALRGGSYLCHDSYCNRYRLAARTANVADASVGNLGFRVAR